MIKFIYSFLLIKVITLSTCEFKYKSDKLDERYFR